ncbi:MAG: acyl-CoA dehydrogenase family protein [Deltaproteobacteria bacterium]|nr:acyl-CoA dehydrogenase family protein [Deltaproteobacteria bacterium]
MNLNNFLANIHFGSLDMEKFHSFRDLEEDEKTREITEKYKEITERYPSSYLEEKGTIPTDLLDELKRIGFFGLNIPKEYGGAGLSLRQYLKVVAELSSSDLALALISLAHLSIGCKGIVLFGTEAQKERYLVPAATGEMIFSYALTEPKTGSDAKHIETFAKLSEDGSYYTLNGHKTYITNANYAGGLTVFAQLDKEKPGFMGAFIVETAWDGVKIGRDMPKMGLKASSTAAIEFKDVRVPVENLLGQAGEGFKIAMTVLNYGRVALGAGSAGALDQARRDMEKQSSRRIQFGVPINTFELIQEKIVKAKVDGYVTGAITAFTAGLLENDPHGVVAIESSHCKLFGTTRAWDTLYNGLQVAGGSGYLATQPYEKRMRDFRVTTIFEGTTEIHSIYPTLFVLRNLDKEMRAVGRSTTSRLAFLLKGMFARSQWKLKFNHRVMNRAVRLAKANSRSIRLLLQVGMLIYGKKIQSKQFFLRRITNLSLYLFGILSVVAKIDAEEKMGRDVSEDVKILAYFVEEARQARKDNRRLLSSKREALHKKIFQGIVPPLYSPPKT